jgi:adenylate cyclase
MSIVAEKQRQSLNANILSSEIKRYAYMAAIFALFALIIRVVGWVYPQGALLIFKTETMVRLLPLMPGSFAVYALLSRFYLRRMQLKRKQLQPWFQYFSSFLEISILTLAILAFSSVQERRLTILLTPFPFVYFVFIIFSILRLRPALCIFTGVIAGIQYLIFFLYFYDAVQVAGTPDAYLYIPPPHFIRVVMLVASGVIAGYVTQQISQNLTHSFERAQEAERVTQMFGRYVSDKVAEKLLSVGEIEDDKPEATAITVLFFDIRNFTGVTEKLPVETTFSELNRFLTRAADIVGENGGFINKLLGDGFLAVFGAPLEDPLHAQGAVNAARGLGIEFDKMKNSGFIFQDYGIGMHTGIAMVGSLGSDARREYTVIGDTVNLASRVESINKELKTRILMTEETMHAAGVNNATRISEITVRGREAPVTVYEILA